jgi:hypothetical protein
MPQQRPIELVWFRWRRPRPQTVRLETRARATSYTPEEIAAATGKTPEEIVALPDARWLVTADEGTPYEPFAADEPLFRLFADLPPLGRGDDFERAAVTFAETWGLLGITDLSTVETERAQLLTPAEPLDVWIEETRAMRVAVDLFDAIQKKSYHRLREWITVRDGRASLVYRFRRNDAQGTTGGTVIVRQHTTDRVPNLLAAARHLLWAEFINPRLRKHVSVVGVLERNRTRLLRAVPQNLLGALWLALARAVDENRRYRPCAYRHCQKWIEITGTFTGHTKARKFCSDAHRVYEHQRRHPKSKAARSGGGPQ